MKWSTISNYDSHSFKNTQKINVTYGFVIKSWILNWVKVYKPKSRREAEQRTTVHRDSSKNIFYPPKIIHISLSVHSNFNIFTAFPRHQTVCFLGTTFSQLYNIHIPTRVQLCHALYHAICRSAVWVRLLAVGTKKEKTNSGKTVKSDFDNNNKMLFTIEQRG